MSACVFTCSCFCTSNFRDVSVVYYTHMFKDVSVLCVLLPLSSCGRTHRWRTGIWEWWYQAERPVSLPGSHILKKNKIYKWLTGYTLYAVRECENKHSKESSVLNTEPSWLHLIWWRWPFSMFGTRNTDPRSVWTANVEELKQDIYYKNWKSIEDTISAQVHQLLQVSARQEQTDFTHRVYCCNLLLGQVFLFLLFICAVLLHGFSAGEVNGPAGDLGLRLPTPMFFHLHPLKILLCKLIVVTMILLQNSLLNSDKPFLNKEHLLQ